ncbi:MAG: DUF697 domain-containing protein [Planctomycetes bacterium]|nr:DUF697 domain-containing protein [Planctomycetota bacterium]
MGYMRDLIEHVAESFNTLFNLDADPALSEDENVERVIGHTATVAAIVCCMQPIPAGDFLILTPIQAKMALHIGRVKGFEVSSERAQEIVVEVVGILGMTLTTQLVVVSVAKLVPFVGGVLSIPIIYAATWAIGNVVDYYFNCLKADQRPSAEVMKDLFAEQFRVGKAKGAALDRSELERKADELRRKVEARDAELRTETRLDPRPEAAARRPAAGAPPPAEDGAGRRKIKITIGGGPHAGRAGGGPNPARSDDADIDDPRPRGKKTIGPEADGALGLAPPGTPLGEVAPPAPATKTVGHAPEPAPAPAPEPVTAAAPGFVDQLERLGKLRQAGVLTTDEFEQAKRKLLGL